MRWPNNLKTIGIFLTVILVPILAVSRYFHTTYRIGVKVDFKGVFSSELDSWIELMKEGLK